MEAILLTVYTLIRLVGRFLPTPHNSLPAVLLISVDLPRHNNNNNNPFFLYQ